MVNFTKYIEGWVSQRLRPDERKDAKEAMESYKVYLEELKSLGNIKDKKSLYKRYKRRLNKLKLSHRLEGMMDTAANGQLHIIQLMWMFLIHLAQLKLAMFYLNGTGKFLHLYRTLKGLLELCHI